MYTRAVFYELLERKMANISETVSKVMYVRDVSWNVGSMEKLFRMMLQSSSQVIKQHMPITRA